MASLEEQVQKLDFEGIIIGAIITALAFVMGLFWRDAISATINQFLPEGEGLFYMYLVAIIATIVVVVMAFLLIKLQKIEITKEIAKGQKKIREKGRKIAKLEQKEK